MLFFVGWDSSKKYLPPLFIGSKIRQFDHQWIILLRIKKAKISSTDKETKQCVKILSLLFMSWTIGSASFG